MELYVKDTFTKILCNFVSYPRLRKTFATFRNLQEKNLTETQEISKLQKLFEMSFRNLRAVKAFISVLFLYKPWTPIVFRGL